MGILSDTVFQHFAEGFPLSIVARFKKSDAVIFRPTLEMGKVVGEPVLDGGEFWYRVRFVARVENIPEDDLESPEDEGQTVQSLAQAGLWGRVRAFRCALAVERITNVSQTTLYSFNAQRILFEAYQYKPLLRLLESSDRRLLIADEVGLGKTIEAGLALAEMEARHQGLDKVLIVCPSRLRDKWREELNRKFRQDFDILSRSQIDGYLVRLAQNADNSRLRAIVSLQTLRSRDLFDRLEAAVGSIDFIVVDEAHHGRNLGTQTHRLVQRLGQLGNTVLFLTATPLQLGTDDLFNLLKALRPTEFRESEVLSKTLDIHRGIYVAARAVRSGGLEGLERCKRALEDIYIRGGRSSNPDPIALQVIEEISQRAPIDRREWAELEKRVLDLHPLASIVTRTRKRDVQEHAPVRRAATQVCSWTEEEDKAYQRFVGLDCSLGWFRQPLSLGQIQRARQAASSIHAAILARAGRCYDSDHSTEITDIDPEDLPSLSTDAAEPEVPLLPRRDSKFETLMGVLRQIAEIEPQSKVLIFTFFVGTAKYLAAKLLEQNITATWIAGETPSTPNRPETDQRGNLIRQFREDPAIRVLVSTEVGSEGLDFQFCHHLVNYDLPWNPMVVEQRIGRIDRFGQRSDVVHIHNLVVAGTVEQEILLRLYERIKIFEHSVGDLEAILGEAVRELQHDYIKGTLSSEESERRVEQAARAIENRRLSAEELEEHASDLFGHEEFIRNEMSRVKRLGRYLTPSSTLALLEAYLDTHHPNVRIWQDRPGTHSLRMGDRLYHAIRSAENGQIWAGPGVGATYNFTMDGNVAFDNERIDLLNASHPFVRVAVTALRERLEEPTALLSQAILRLSSNLLAPIESGLHYVVVYAHLTTGLRNRRELDAIVWSVARSSLLDSEVAEELLHVALEEGEEWIGEVNAPAIPHVVWAEIESQARARNRSLYERRRTENAALTARRRAVLDQEYEYACEQIRIRRMTAQENARGREILALFDAQLAKAEVRFERQCAEIDRSQHVTARLSEPLAACALQIIR